MRLVDDVRLAWRWISIRCMAAAAAVQGAWEFMPADMREGLADQHVRWVTVALLLLGIAGRLVKQDKP